MKMRCVTGACRIALILICLASVFSCKKDTTSSPPLKDDGGGDTYDISSYGIPRFVSNDYIQLERIGRISRFRSGIGHDFSDDFESCRSMKHYFEPKDSIDWTTVHIYAPVDGSITVLTDEWAGTKIEIRSKLYPAFFFDIFHVSLSHPLKVGDTLAAGTLLGTHIGSQTMSDMAVAVTVPQQGPKSGSAHGRMLLSYFDVMTDPLFVHYQGRGLLSRVDAVISRGARDRDTISCAGDTFSSEGTIENWVTLN
jgi:hypothetical protein